MNVSEAIEKIKVMLADNAVEQTEEIASEPATQLIFETYDLKDGSKIDLSALEIGGDAMLVDESGNSVSAPDGEYELADGTMITVVGGKVEGGLDGVDLHGHRSREVGDCGILGRGDFWRR